MTLYNVIVTLCKVSAPFVPFITEDIYQNLVVNIDKTAKESIHLCLWPEVNESAINKELEKEMDLAYSLVKLGRSARNAANIKNRQPLSEILVSINTLPEYYGEIIKNELNIKKIEFGADLSEHVNFEIKPNLPVMGRAYGKLIPGIKKAIAERNQMELAQNIKAGKTETINVDGTEIDLNSENLLVTMQGIEGYAFAGEGELGVVLLTNITEELKEEGYIREIISKVQNMRKEKGFEVADKIKLYISGNQMLASVIDKYKDTILKETLTTEIISDDKNADYTESTINGETINIDVKVV
jgi:isoleucyl-tRNA synthetase